MARQPHHAASTALRRVEARLCAGDPATIGMLLDTLGEAGLPLAMVLLALTAVLPIPVVPTGPVTGALVMVLAVQYGFGARRMWLPRGLLRCPLPRRPLVAVLRRAVPLLESVERQLRPGRLRWITGRVARPVLGIAAFLLGLASAVPVPFGSLPPGIALILLGLGLLARDGLAVLIGLGAGLLAITWVAVLTAGALYALHLALAALAWR